MSYVEDRWFRPGSADEPARVPTARNGRGLRYRARWLDGPGAERSKSFRRKLDADRFLEKLETRGCLVPDCRRTSVTEEPVLLCGDHRDILIAQCAPRQAGALAPVVYFARMGSRVKIGWTTNVKRRMSAMSLPLSCVVVTIDGGAREGVGPASPVRQFADPRQRVVRDHAGA